MRLRSDRSEAFGLSSFESLSLILSCLLLRSSRCCRRLLGFFSLNGGNGCSKARLIDDRMNALPSSQYTRRFAETWEHLNRVERVNKNSAHFIIIHILLQPFHAVWVQIIGQNGTPVLSSRDGERPDTGHDICNNSILRLEKLHEALMLCLQARIPVDFSKVERELAIRFGLGNEAGQHK